MQTLGNVLKVDNSIYVESSLSLFWLYVLHHILLEAAAELRYILDFERKAYSVGMSTEVLEQIATTLYGIIDIISSHAACRACSQTIELG